MGRGAEIAGQLTANTVEGVEDPASIRERRLGCLHSGFRLHPEPRVGLDDPELVYPRPPVVGIGVNASRRRDGYLVSSAKLPIGRVY